MEALRIKRIDKLIGLTVLGAILTVWLALTGLDASSGFLRQLSHVGKHGYSVTDAAFYILMTFPRRLYEMYLYAVLIGTLLGLGGMASYGELVALRASGMSPARMSGTVGAVVAVGLLVVMVMGETVVPWSERRVQMMQLQARSGHLDLTRGKGLWVRDGERIIHARTSMFRQVAGHDQVQLVDVRVFTLTPDGQLCRFDQARVAWHEKSRWVLDKVHTTTLNRQGVYHSYFAHIIWNSSLDPSLLQHALVKPRYLSMRDLYRSMHYLESHGENTRPYAMAFWGRVLYPFNVLVLAICMVPFALGNLRSGGLGKRIFIGMLLALAWYFVQKVMVSFATVYGVSTGVANSIPVIGLVFLAWLHFQWRNQAR